MAVDYLDYIFEHINQETIAVKAWLEVNKPRKYHDKKRTKSLPEMAFANDESLV